MDDEDSLSHPDFSKILLKLLKRRGVDIHDEESIRKFLNPSLEDLYPPYLLPDAEKSVERIKKAIINGEKILIHGDFDVDGITSLALLYRFFSILGVEPDVYIPHRIKEGYGISDTAILKARVRGVSLMIVVDSGTTEHHKVNLASSLGMDVIIIDHHLPKKSLPDAFAIVNPFRRDSRYPFMHLASVGVVFKILMMLAESLNVKREEVMRLLPLVVIGTVADVMPLLDENRIMVKRGMEMFKDTDIKGIKELMKVAGLNRISTRAIGYIIAPRLNAAGRISSAEKSFRLMVTEDLHEAEQLAEELDLYNRKRQSIESKILEESFEIIDRRGEVPPVIVVAGEEWHEGVVGIVSSRITERYRRPSIVISLKGNRGRGSGRSVEGFDLFELLTHFEDYMVKFGGHSMAVGLTIERKAFKKFQEELERYVSKVDIPPPEVLIEHEVDEITPELLREIEMLKPFGEGNPEPLLCMRDVEILEFPRLFKNNHIKFNLKKKGKIYTVMGFNMGERFHQLRCGEKTDVVFRCRKEEHAGFIEIKLYLEDFRNHNT